MTIKTLLDWRHQYDTARDKKEGDLAALECLDESLTQQHFTKDADINEIVQRFGLTGIPAFPLDPQAFRDTTADPDLRQILDQNIEARNYFNALPHKLRQRFHYSMGELWEFVNDPENAEEALRLGLLAREPTERTRSSAGADAPADRGNATASSTPTDTGKASSEGTQTPPETPQRGA